MSMLAGPRKRQKVFNLRAKNNAWSSDSEKFGQKMLEKMGWSAGKGLGAKENGVVEHVLARYKNDSAGLGFQDRNDQWTNNELDFEGLLKSLSEASDANHDSPKFTSLEEKSKRSQARVHYHKFTRSKDLSTYSSKDLANIFGKKSMNAKPKEKSDGATFPQDEISTITGQLFTSKGTTVDYFRKLKDKNLRLSNNINNSESDARGDIGYSGFLQCGEENQNDSVDNALINVNDNRKSSKKKSRRMETSTINGDSDCSKCTSSTDVINNSHSGNIVEDDSRKKKKKRKSKSSKSTVDENLLNILINDNHFTEETSNTVCQSAVQFLENIQDQTVKIKKKKRQKESSNLMSSNVLREDTLSKKKQKLSQNFNTTSVLVDEEIEDGVQVLLNVEKNKCGAISLNEIPNVEVVGFENDGYSLSNDNNTDNSKLCRGNHKKRQHGSKNITIVDDGQDADMTLLHILNNPKKPKKSKRKKTDGF